MAIISSINVGDHLRSTLVVKITYPRLFNLRLKLFVFALSLITHLCPLEVELIQKDGGSEF